MIAHAMRRSDGLKTIDFLSNTGVETEDKRPLSSNKLILLWETELLALQILHICILDLITHPTPFIPEDVLYHQRINVTRKQEAVARHIAQIQQLEQ